MMGNNTTFYIQYNSPFVFEISVLCEEQSRFLTSYSACAHRRGEIGAVGQAPRESGVYLRPSRFYAATVLGIPGRDSSVAATSYVLSL